MLLLVSCEISAYLGATCYIIKIFEEQDKYMTSTCLDQLIILDDSIDKVWECLSPLNITKVQHIEA